MIDIALIYPYFMPKGDKSTFRFPPLGLGYIASYLGEHGFNVTIIDGTFQTENQVIQKISQINPAVIGIQCILGTEKSAFRLAESLKRANNLLIAGGPQASIEPSMFLDKFDLVVIGEGEQTVLEIVENYCSGKDYRNIDGIAFRAGEKNVYTKPRKALDKLDCLPFPSRKLYPNDNYKALSEKRYGYSITSMITTRGCPFSCDYCSRAVAGSAYNERSIDNVTDEIEQILGLSYNRIWIADDVFTLRKEYVIGICNEIIRRGLKFEWECLSRVDTLNDEMARIMRQAGCKRVFFGIESGNDNILREMKKSITIDNAKKAVGIARKAGLQVGAFFILGYPGESDDTILQTIKFSNTLPLDYVSYTFPYPMPGTGLYEKVKDRLLPGYWDRNGHLLSKHKLMFRGDFSEAKLRFALFKGQTQFMLRKHCKNNSFAPYSIFDKATEIIFRAMR